MESQPDTHPTTFGLSPAADAIRNDVMRYIGARLDAGTQPAFVVAGLLAACAQALATEALVVGPKVIDEFTAAMAKDARNMVQGAICARCDTPATADVRHASTRWPGGQCNVPVCDDCSVRVYEQLADASLAPLEIVRRVGA